MNESLSNLTPEEFYKELSRRFEALLNEHGLLKEEVRLTTKSLKPEEAIGITRRKDYPILTGKDVMIEADCHGSLGQAFTDAPMEFCGTLEEVCKLDLSNDSHNRGIFIASLNAVMKHLGIIGCTVHCKGDGPEHCSVEALDYLKEHFNHPRITLIGYQPALFSRLAPEFELRVLDLDPKNIGQEKFGVKVEDGGDKKIQQDACKWAELILCTGSTVCNGTIVDFLPYREKVLFYGTTLAGAAELMGLSRLCFTDHYQNEK